MPKTEVFVGIDEEVDEKGHSSLKTVIKGENIEIEVTDFRRGAKPMEISRDLLEQGFIKKVDEGKEALGNALLSASFRVPNLVVKRKWVEKFNSEEGV